MDFKTDPSNYRGHEEDVAPPSSSAKLTPTGRPKRSKKPKDMPRRPLSAYNLFFAEQRESILKLKADGKTPDDYPEGRVTMFQALAKCIGARWKALAEEDRADFKAKAQEELTRYRVKMQVYNDGQTQAADAAAKILSSNKRKREQEEDSNKENSVASPTASLPPTPKQAVRMDGPSSNATDVPNHHAYPAQYHYDSYAAASYGRAFPTGSFVAAQGFMPPAYPQIPSSYPQIPSSYPQIPSSYPQPYYYQPHFAAYQQQQQQQQNYWGSGHAQKMNSDAKETSPKWGKEQPNHWDSATHNTSPNTKEVSPSCEDRPPLKVEPPELCGVDNPTAKRLSTDSEAQNGADYLKRVSAWVAL